MKALFVPARAKAEFSIPKIRLLPKKLGLIATVQFTSCLSKIKKLLPKVKVFIAKPKGLDPGQILGCNVEAATLLQNKVDAFLYIGSGIFHPLAVALALKKPKPIFIFNPETQQIVKLDEKVIKQAKARQKTAKIKFLSSKVYGILVSTKPGQERLKESLELKEKLEKQGKKAYIFLFNDFDSNQLENFPEIECWINTFCPGMSIEKPMPWIGNYNKKEESVAKHGCKSKQTR